MGSSVPPVFPWECRDKEDEAKDAYNNPHRRANQALTDENLRLKRILRENGITWSPIASNHLKQLDPSQRRTRSSTSALDLGHSWLPMEIMLRILKFAMKSPYPIIDPLSPLTPENLSEQEKNRGNQIAVHFLATCRVMHTEGTRYLWTSNEFTFTTHHALRNFAELNSKFREGIKHVNLRIIARYYDDQRRRHKLESRYHPELKKSQPLRVYVRPTDSPLVRGGFRCYTWNQIVDFLESLRPPFDPAFRGKKNLRPKLLPSLVSLRLDLVNFSDTLLPFSGHDLHEMTSHEFGCTLNELQITGMPLDDTGMKASAELCGMLKDEGLFLDGAACFVAQVRHLQPLSGNRWCARVIRSSKPKDNDTDSSDDDTPDFAGHSHTSLGLLPPAPPEEGAPLSTKQNDRIIWKRVPPFRDEPEREWVPFSRKDGYETCTAVESDNDVCSCCAAHDFESLDSELNDDDMD